MFSDTCSLCSSLSTIDPLQSLHVRGDTKSLNTESFRDLIRGILDRCGLTLSWELPASSIRHVVHIREHFKDGKLLKRCLSVRTCRMKGLMYIDGPFHAESWGKYLSHRLEGLQADSRATGLVYLQHHEYTASAETGNYTLQNLCKRRNQGTIMNAALLNLTIKMA
jgi:hypothetical protein